MKIGYALSSEEHAPSELVRCASRAEEVGFDFAMISDHFHPWIDRQGESSFVWSVIGAIAASTERIEVVTGVTCPLIRIHPAIVAQAAATVSDMMPGRFSLGLGTGENLNEHVVGEGWPPAGQRLSMLEEAVAVIRDLFSGENVNHDGPWFAVENAKLYTMPDDPPPILMAAAGQRAAKLAGGAGDGLISTSPQAEIVDAFRAAGGDGKPAYAQVTLCWATSEAEARRTAREVWPNAGLQGELTQELPLPRHFEQAVEPLSEDKVAESVVCGPDPKPVLESIRTYQDAGFDHIYLHQVGPDQDGFFGFFESELMSQLEAHDRARGSPI